MFRIVAITTTIGLFVFVTTWRLWTSLSEARDDILARAMSSAAVRDLSELDRCLKELRSGTDHREEVLYLKGVRALLAGRPESALSFFRLLKPDGELRLPLLEFTGEALYKVGDYGAAEGCFIQILASRAEDANAHRWLAAINYDLGRTDAALDHLQTLIRLDPNDYRPHRMMGVIYKDFAQPAAAVQAFSEALSKARDESQRFEILSILAELQIERKEFSEAEKLLSEMPETVAVLVMRAECRWSQGETQQAADLIHRAAALGELPPKGMLLKARVLLDAGKVTEASELLEDAARLDPSSEECEFLLATCLRQLGDDVRASQHMARTEEIKRLKTQLTELSTEAMENQNDPIVRIKLAETCDQLGMKAMSEVWRKAAARCRPTGSPETAVP